MQLVRLLQQALPKLAGLLRLELAALGSPHTHGATPGGCTSCTFVHLSSTCAVMADALLSAGSPVGETLTPTAPHQYT